MDKHKEDEETIPSTSTIKIFSHDIARTRVLVKVLLAVRHEDTDFNLPYFETSIWLQRYAEVLQDQAETLACAIKDFPQSDTKVRDIERRINFVYSAATILMSINFKGTGDELDPCGEIITDFLREVDMSMTDISLWYEQIKGRYLEEAEASEAAEAEEAKS